MITGHGAQDEEGNLGSQYGTAINNSNEVGVAVIFDKEAEGEEAKEGLKSKELTKSAGR